MANRNFPYENTVILQDEALDRLLQLIKNYPTAGKNTGIKLVPDKNGNRVQIQNARKIYIIDNGGKSQLVIEDSTSDMPDQSWYLSELLDFEENPAADATPGVFKIYTYDTNNNKQLKYTVRISGFDNLGNINMPNNTISANKVSGAIWNDYAEYRESFITEPGRCVIETGFGDLELSSKRLQLGANIVSDTFGFSIGETDKAKTPIAVCGRVLAYPFENRYDFTPGAAVCSGPDGTISLMTRNEIKEWPDAIVGYVSEIPEYKTWGTNNISINNRIWIKIK